MKSHLWEKKKKPNKNQTRKTPTCKQTTSIFDVRIFFSNKLVANILQERKLVSKLKIMYIIQLNLVFCSFYSIMYCHFISYIVLPTHHIVHLSCFTLLWGSFQLFMGTGIHIKHSRLNRFRYSDF